MTYVKYSNIYLFILFLSSVRVYLPMFYALDIDRYDYLEFTDSRGGKVRYDMKVGTEKWPKVGFGKPMSCVQMNYCC